MYGIWKDMPHSLFNVMEEDETVTLLLLQLGIVLCPDIKPLKYWKSSNNIIETGEDIDGCLKEMQYNCHFIA